MRVCGRAGSSRANASAIGLVGVYQEDVQVARALHALDPDELDRLEGGGNERRRQSAQGKPGVGLASLQFTVPVFDIVIVAQDCPGPGPDRIVVAQITGAARHHARWRHLTGDEETAAVAELRALAAGRADLLAEVAGVLEGASEGRLDEPFARSAAQLCRKSGADPEAIPAWIEVGRRRAAVARMPPPRYS